MKQRGDEGRNDRTSNMPSLVMYTFGRETPRLQRDRNTSFLQATVYSSFGVLLENVSGTYLEVSSSKLDTGAKCPC